MTQNQPMQDNPTPPPSIGNEFLTKLSRSAGAATTMVARQAERTTITTVSLPAAYKTLGRDCVHHHRHLEDVPDLIERFQVTLAELKAISDHRKTQPPNQSFTEKAIAVARQAAALAREKQLEMKRDSVLEELGKAIYGLHGDMSGPAEIVTPIRTNISRLVQIDSEITRASATGKGSWITPKLLLMAPAAIIILIAGYSLSPRHSSDWTTPENKGNATTFAMTVNKSDLNDEIVKHKSDALVRNDAGTIRAKIDLNTPSDWHQRLFSLRKLKAGMHVDEIESILGPADETNDDISANDPTGILSQRGETLTILTWHGDDPGENGDFIKIGLINERLTNREMIEVNSSKK